MTNNKNLINFIILLLFVIIVLLFHCIKQQTIINNAKNYINDLEEDFPEYIDVTAERDSYTEYYDI